MPSEERFGSASRVVVGVREMTAGLSPNSLTMELKCSGIVCGSNGGWSVSQYSQLLI
jgi:hypothetical protein